MSIRPATMSRSFVVPSLGRMFDGRARTFLRDWSVLVAIIGVYLIARGSAPDRTSFAVDVARWIVDLEQRLHIFWEPAVQAASIRFHVIQELANFTYAYLHFPVLAAVGLWLWCRDRAAFALMRNTMIISMAIGLFFYFLVPAAPPRLMALHGYDFGFTDTVFGGETAVNYAQPSLILNEYAAIPSFHFGWIVMASAAIWVNTESRALRVFAVALSVLMTWAIVASANHLFFDMALGGVVIAVSWWLAARLRRPVERPGKVVSIERDVLCDAA